jgi:hypothetical protein
VNLYEIISTLQDPPLKKALDEYARSRLPEFKQVLSAHPLRTNSIGGISICEAFWLYNFVKDLHPSTIIESGTLYGFSLYFLCRARSASGGKVLSFDPFTEPKLTFGAEYHKDDWVSYQVPPGAFVFFDDHVDQGRRLMEAKKKGVKHVMFHDNYLNRRHSHTPIRLCDTSSAQMVYIFDRLDFDPIFTDTTNNAQTYRWLTYVGLGE